jgi:hypothetical protein
MEKVIPTAGTHVRRTGVIQYASDGPCRGAVPAFAAMLLWSLLMVPYLLSQQSKPNEYQVKATYLYNFGRFVKWPGTVPAGKGDSFRVCVLGQDPFGTILDSTLAGEALDGKPVVLRRISRPQEAGECRILYISSTEEKRLKEILTAVDENGVLTVSDIPGFTRRGGIIQFVLEGDRVRFEINLASAESARLVLSSELLKVAAAVRRSARSGD